MQVIGTADLESISGGNVLANFLTFVDMAIKAGTSAIVAVDAVNTTNVQTYGYDTATSLMAAGNLGA